MAVRQTCRKLDLYWNESIFDSVVKKSSVRSLMTQYIVRINSVSCAGKSYDDTLLDEGILWSFDTTQVAAEPQDIEPDEVDESNTADAAYALDLLMKSYQWIHRSGCRQSSDRAS